MASGASAQPPVERVNKPSGGGFGRRHWYFCQRALVGETRHTMKGIITAAAALVLTVGAASCAVPEEESDTKTNVGGSGGGGGKAKQNQKKEKQGPDNSTATKDGPLTWGNWQVVGTLQIKEDGLQQFEGVMRVKNMGESPDEGFFTVTVLKKQRVLTTLDCSTSRIGPGQIGTAECFGFDDFVPGWTEVTVENAF